MCFSPEVSFVAAASLLPAGGLALQKAWQTDRSYVPFAVLPILFGLQQLAEGMVRVSDAWPDRNWVETFSLAYMFFSWLAWPVWVPVLAYFLEPCGRRYIYLAFAIIGGMLGAMQFFPYFAHDGWLITRFLPRAISYEGTVLFDFIMRRELTYAIYLFIIIAPLLVSTNRDARRFGVLISIVVLVTYVFFSYAYISVFCFGGAVMSSYIIYAVFQSGTGLTETEWNLQSTRW